MRQAYRTREVAVTPHQQSPGAIRREWARTPRNVGGLYMSELTWRHYARYNQRVLAREYADARALQSYLRGVGDNE